MKKLISLVMAAAMVASLVPATAFAASGSEISATAKIVKASKVSEGFGGAITTPELQVKVSAVDYLVGGTNATVNYELKVSLDNADFTDVVSALSAGHGTTIAALKAYDVTNGTAFYTGLENTLKGLVSVTDEDGNVITTAAGAAAATPVRQQLDITVSDISTDEVTFTIDDSTGAVDGRLEKNDVIAVKLTSTMDKTSAGKTATVSVESDGVDADDLVYCTVLDQEITASVKKTVDIAEDEVQTLDSKGLKIKSAVDKTILQNQEFELKLSSGFKFNNVTSKTGEYTFGTPDDNVVRVQYVNATATGDFTIDGADIEIEADTAKSGAVATLTVKADKNDTITDVGAAITTPISASSSVEVAKVCNYTVNLTVDEDEDVPVIYSGTDADNTGLTDDSDHLSLEVTAKESFPGAWSMRQGFNFNLPEGVYVTDVDVKTADNFYQSGSVLGSAAGKAAWDVAFFDAYQDGDHENFEFGKRVFDDVNTTLSDDPAELSFQLELVADPTFEGDVVLTFEGALVETQTVTIAKFVKPYTVKAEQNDVIIDYRNTTIDTPITITEAAEGLFAKNTDFTLLIEDNKIDFDGDPEVAADDASEMTIKDDDTTAGTFVFTIDDESDSAATITISDMELYMNRSIPAGGYDLKVSTTMSNAYDAQVLFAPDNAANFAGMAAAITTANAAWAANARTSANTTVKDSYIDDVTDYSSTVKEAFINVVTSGRDQDNLFTTKVVVPVGEAYLVAGETKVTLDAPAYISAAGYTMLPVRAVSSALGVDTNNVLWNAETKTVTIMFAQRIISMTVGQKTVYVNGSPIPTSAAPEITNGRTYLPLRDLGTALGVTNVSWDAATKTATLN